METGVFLFFIVFGLIGAVPYYEDSFEKAGLLRPRERIPKSNPNDKPFEIDVLTSELEGRDSSPAVSFQQPFPFFGIDFFNPLSSFGFVSRPSQGPWWKGPNVCVEKLRDVETDQEGANGAAEEEHDSSTMELSGVPAPFMTEFHLSMNSCVDKLNKQVCTKIVNQNGIKKSITVTRQCCHGFGRPRDADDSKHCEKIEIKNIEETAADMGAKEFVASAKSNGFSGMVEAKNITVFLPVDAAFIRFNERMLNEKNLVETRFDDSMPNMFSRHIVPGKINLDDVANERVLQSQLKQQTIRINTYPVSNVFAPERSRYTANCVPIEKYDQPTEQGVVHTLRGVMKPVSKGVMDIIRHRADMSVMRMALENTNLSKLLEREGAVTVFVPTDKAFEKLEPKIRRALKEGSCASRLLKNHILDQTFCSAACMPGKVTTAYNLLGETMHFSRNLTLRSEKSKDFDLEDAQSIVINGVAKVVENDLMGNNGVVHVIDNILYTSSSLPLSMRMQEQNITLFKRLVAASGLGDKFEQMVNVTIIAPTDKALEGTKWAQSLVESPERLNGNAELLEIINYHVVSPMMKTCDLSEKLLPTAAGPAVRINLYSTHSLFSAVMNRATVNCARLVRFDAESCGSVLHQVDKLLTPPKMNLLQTLASNPSYSRFLKLVQVANMTGVLDKSNASLTLLVPKNEVFEEVKDWETAFIKNQSHLTELAKAHIIGDVMCCAGIIQTYWPFVRTVKAFNGAYLQITRDRRPRIENAGITKCDIIATNGIIHEINDLIVSDIQQRRPQTDKHGFFQLDDFFF